MIRWTSSMRRNSRRSLGACLHSGDSIFRPGVFIMQRRKMISLKAGLIQSLMMNPGTSSMCRVYGRCRDTAIRVNSCMRRMHSLTKRPPSFSRDWRMTPVWRIPMTTVFIVCGSIFRNSLSTVSSILFPMV